MKTSQIKVLDHGYVALVDSMGTDETVISAARMSTGKGFTDWDSVYECTGCGDRVRDPNSNTVDLGPVCGGKKHEWKQIQGDKKLLEYLYKNAHLTPFEQCELAIEMQAPIMVFREVHRHRTFSYNEASARYAKMPDLHYLPELSRIQKQATANKQGCAEALPELAAVNVIQDFEENQRNVYETYEDHLEQGVAREVARLNTPVSRYSKQRMKGNLRNWFQFLNLRMRPNAQHEIQEYARAVAEIIKEIWPRSYALFEEYDLKGVRLSATEASMVLMMFNEVQINDELKPQYEALAKKLEGA